jgi:2-haloacid dehalogenase
MQGAHFAPPKACVFDAYGTLFDYGSAAARCGELLGAKRELLNTLWREKQLQYTWLRALQGKHADFWQVTGDALNFALETLGLDAPALRERLMDSYLTLEAFPEVPGVLESLKTKGIKTAILSNGSREMLQAAVSNARIEQFLDAVLSVEEVGVYKPHPKVYQLAVDRLGVRRQGISYQSSNAWDAWAASAYGMRVVWCNRYDQRPERLPGLPDHQVRSLADLPYLVGCS